jgi:integrase
MDPKFKLREYIGTDGLQQLVLVFSDKNGKKLRIDTGIRCKKDHFSEKQGSVNESISELKLKPSEVNSHLLNMKIKLNQIILEHRKTRKLDPDCSFIQQEWNKDIQDIIENKSLVFYIDQYVERFKNELVTVVHHRGLLENIKDLEVENHRKYYFIDINEGFRSELVKYYQRNNYNNSTVKKRFSIFKTILRYYTTTEKVNTNTDFLTFSVKNLKTPSEEDNIITLTFDQFLKLVKTTDLPPYLNKVRLLFLLGCSTGLRYSDIMELNKSHIQNNCIDKLIRKTKKRIRIPLNDLSLSILEGFEYNIPRISMKCLNQYVHLLFKKLEYDEMMNWNRNGKEIQLPQHLLLTFHSSRKFYITHLLRSGLTPLEVMSYSGHRSDYSSFNRYIDTKDPKNKNKYINFKGLKI